MKGKIIFLPGNVTLDQKVMESKKNNISEVYAEAVPLVIKIK